MASTSDEVRGTHAGKNSGNAIFDPESDAANAKRPILDARCAAANSRRHILHLGISSKVQWGGCHDRESQHQYSCVDSTLSKN